MELWSRSMLVTEVFVFKASASAWPKGKRLGSRSRLTSVRRHEIQMRHNSQFPTPSFQRTIPTGFRANVVDTEMHFQPVSCQYPSRKHTTSYHTEWVQVKKKFTHFTDSQQDLEPGNAKDEHEQTTKPFTRLATKTPWAATWNPGTQKAFTPSSPMEFQDRSMLVTEVFVFKASASAWPKGKRLGSISNLTSVRPHEIQMRHNFQFPTPNFQRKTSTGSRIQGKCRLQRCILRQYHANIPVESIPQTTKPSKKLATKTPWAATFGIPGKAFTPSSPMESWSRSMLVTEVFVFKASASAWPKGKRLGSRSRLTSVRRHEIQMRHNSQFPTPSFQRTNSTGSRNQGKCRLLRYISSQYHANIPVESIPHQTTQNEFKSKRNSPTSLTVNKIWNLEMRRMRMSRLQSLSPNWRQRHHEQPLGIPGHKRPSLPQRRWNCHPNRCLSRKCSSSKLQLVPGQMESDLEVDQGWHLWDLMKFEGDKTLSFRLPDSKQQFPLDSGQMSLTQRCTSSQYHANIPVESIPHHTTQNEFKSKRNSPTSLTVNKIWNLEMRRMSMSRLQNLSPDWRQRHHEQPLGIPGHKRPSLLHRRWNSKTGRCLSQKYSSSKLQLVPGRRESDLEVDQGWHLWDVMKYKWDTTLSFRLRVSKEQIPLDLGIRANVVSSDTFPANIMPISQ